MRVVGLDHVVLKVADVERSLAWYQDALGLRGERVDEWRRGEVLFPSVRIDEHTLIDLLDGVPTGTNVDHVCLVIDDGDGARPRSSRRASGTSWATARPTACSAREGSRAVSTSAIPTAM